LSGRSERGILGVPSERPLYRESKDSSLRSE
jgi:hypothetical protein